MGFKEVIRRAYTQTCSNIMNELLFSNYSLAYPLLSKLAVALPLSNAECERFQCNKHTKTTLRNSLATRSINALLHISLNGPTRKQFNFKRTVDKWVRLKTDD